jgi:hypothetical protein
LAPHRAEISGELAAVMDLVEEEEPADIGGRLLE